MKLETVQLILLLSVPSLCLSVLVSWQNYSGDQDKLILPILLVLTCHQKFSDYNLLRNVIFGSVLLLKPKGALSSNNHQSNEAQNVMQMRNFPNEGTISQGKKHGRPKSLNNVSKVPNKLESDTQRKSLRPQLTKKKSSISRRKEELSNRILEEIEALDPLKCLPKALCSLSVQSADSATDSNSYDSSQGQEQKRKNNNVVNEYLDLMQTIITMEPSKKRQEKKRKLALTQLERPPSSRDSVEDEEDEENSEEEEDDNDDEKEDEESAEEEKQQNSQRTGYGQSSSDTNKFDKDYHRERHKIMGMLATTESPDEISIHTPVILGSRHRLRSGQTQKLRHGHNHRKPEPVSYSQQYNYMSGPPGYHGPGYHEPIEDHKQSFTSILYHFMPHWIKKIIDIFIPSITFQYKPVDHAPNIFSEDPFFNGFKKRDGWALNEEEDRSFHGHNKMRPTARSMSDIMVDARERFAGAIEIGETFRNLRKCDAVYSTCPFKHTQIISMIDVLKKKMMIQNIVDKRIANLENKRQTTTGISKKKDEDYTVESQPQEKQPSTSVLTRRKSPNTENTHNAYTRESLSFSHDKNFKRKPLVIRNINKILGPGLSSSEDTVSNKIQHRLTLQIPSTNSREKTANINTQGSGISAFSALSAEYYSDSGSDEDLLALANSRAPQRKKYTIKRKPTKISDQIINGENKKPLSSTTDSPSLFQSILSFF